MSCCAGCFGRSRWGFKEGDGMVVNRLLFNGNLVEISFGLPEKAHTWCVYVCVARCYLVPRTKKRFC